MKKNIPLFTALALLLFGGSADVRAELLAAQDSVAEWRQDLRMAFQMGDTEKVNPRIANPVGPVIVGSRLAQDRCANLVAMDALGGEGEIQRRMNAIFSGLTIERAQEAFRRGVAPELRDHPDFKTQLELIADNFRESELKAEIDYRVSFIWFNRAKSLYNVEVSLTAESKSWRPVDLAILNMLKALPSPNFNFSGKGKGEECRAPIEPLLRGVHEMEVYEQLRLAGTRLGQSLRALSAEEWQRIRDRKVPKRDSREGSLGDKYPAPPPVNVKGD